MKDKKIDIKPNTYEKFIAEDGRMGYRQYDEEYEMWVEIFYPIEETEETIQAKKELDISMEHIYIYI